MNKLYYIIALLLLASCSTDDIANAISGDDALEITGINACVDNGAEATTRAVAALADNVGRTDFVANDIIVFTDIQRTEHPVGNYMYPHEDEVIDFIRTDQTSWERNSGKPERIYWTDALSPHTFKGFGCPQGENKPEDFDWNKGTDGSAKFYAYFGSLGNPTLIQTSSTNDKGEAVYTNFIDYSNEAGDTPDPTTKKYHTGNTKICKDDILLAYNTAQQADVGGQVATIHFYHGLSCVRVVVNISGFAASSTSVDTLSHVTNLDLLDMRTMYKWDQQSHNCGELIADDQNYLNTFFSSATDKPTWNQAKRIRCWIPNPDGVGKGNTKTFTFYGLAVPTTGKTQEITFYVTYPDPMNPNKNTTKPYTATIDNVEFRAGHCTTINISLNHSNDKMTVGAEYQDWKFIHTPDQGELKKDSTFLSYIPTNDEDRIAKKIYIADDAQATADDALWLYKVKDAQGNILKDAQGNDIIMDIYDNDGTMTKPYTISTANQLLAFAYEVKSGRDFVHKFVKLDTDITLQSSLTGTGLRWIGIGDATHDFNGFFLGDGRHINRLYGEHFFYMVGENAVIDKVNFQNVLEVLGCGVIAHENKGLICSCYIDGEVKETATADTKYTGSIVGTNNSFIIACSHVGKVSGYGKVGGLVGYNNGTVMASYHSGEIVALDASSGGEAHPTAGAYGDGNNNTNRSIMFSCYYDSNVFKDNRDLVPGQLGYPLPTSVMQSFAFVRDADDITAPSFEFDSSGKYIGATGPELRTIAEIIVRQKGGYSEEDIQNMTNEQLIELILPADAMSDEVYKVFENHFALNTALRVFRYWVGRIYQNMQNHPEAIIKTNCHDFSKEQITFLYNHYNAQHVFLYTPATYPKAQ